MKHPMPWTIEDLSDSRYDSAGEEYIEPHFMVRDTNSHLVVELHDRRVAARIVALTKVVVAAKEFQEAYDKNHRVIIKRLNLYAKLTELEALP